MTRRSLLGLVLLGLAACDKPAPEPERAPDMPKAVKVEPTSSANTTAAGPADVAYDTPAAWTSIPNPNAMRKATFKVPKVLGDSEDAELSVSSAGGSVDANIDRWAGQFGSATPKKEPRSPNGLKVTYVEIAGTYAGMGGSSKEHWMLIGAVVDGGSQLHFFKLTGPEKTVTAAKKDFDAFVSSLRAK